MSTNHGKGVTYSLALEIFFPGIPSINLSETFPMGNMQSMDSSNHEVSCTTEPSSIVPNQLVEIPVVEDNDLPPIRLIDFDDFARRTSFPRYPENKDITLILEKIDRENAFIVFISHCWLRGWSGAVGWDGRPHPDNPRNEKFVLCKRGILQAWRSLAPRMKKCYVWLDFGCMNQDADPAGELKQLHDIVGSCDCLFTPIVQSDFNWRFNPCYENIYLEYMAEAWNVGPHAYLNRGWTRVEMLYASTIPLNSPTHGERYEKFAEGMKFQHGIGRRPHLLFGTHELKKALPVIIIPPLSNSYFEDFHPEKGNVSYENDRVKIRSLVKWIQPLVTKGVCGYDGEYNESNEKHGLGTETYPNGNFYTGMFENNKRHGIGKLQRSDGGWYEGDWKDDEMSGHGTFHVASGDVYIGEFSKGLCLRRKLGGWLLPR